MLVAAFALTACGMAPGDETSPPRRTVDLAPTFTPAQTERPQPSGRPSAPARPRADATTTTAPQRTAPRATQQLETAPASTSRVTPARMTARAEDTTNDVDWTLQRPPEYADIAVATLTRTADGFTLRMRFMAEVPPRQQNGNRTMNVASFFDTTGDGEIDYEIWANLADNGWGPSYRDRRNNEARFMTESGVRVAAKGHSLVFRFPLGHLNEARSLQWATASEWGSYETISTAAAARDHAPNTGAAPFPG